MLLATDWGKWTAIATFIAAAAAIGLAVVTAWLVVTTRRMVRSATEEITLERQRIEAANRPNVFPAPGAWWGDDSSDEIEDWRGFFPVTNGGPGVALNVMAQLRWTSASGISVQTVPTSLGPGESRDLVVPWPSDPPDEWLQVEGSLYYNDVSGALWETKFRIYRARERHFIEVLGTHVVKDAEGNVVG